MALQTKRMAQILTDMINYMNGVSSKVKDFSLGSVARSILSAVAFFVDELYFVATQLYAAAFITTANGDDLDAQALPFTPRQGVKAAAGYVTYSRLTNAGSDYIIPSGSFIITDPDPVTGVVKQYYTVQTKYIKTGYKTHLARAISIYYNGAAATATLTLAGTTLSAATAGAVDDFSITITDSAYNTLEKLKGYLNNFNGGGKYVVAFLAANATFGGSTGPEQSEWLAGESSGGVLASITGRNIKAIGNICNIIREDPMPVVADTAGPDFNASAGLLTTMKSNVAGVDSVTNKWALMGGADKEIDSLYRNRATTVISTLATGVNDEYIQWAIESNPDTVIRGYTIPYNRGGGTLDVLIAATYGIATSTLIAAAKTYIQTRMPPLVDMDVITFSFVTVNVVGSIVLKKGYVSTTVEPNIRKALDNLLSYVTYPFDEDLTIARITNAILAVDGVYNVTITTPAGTTTINNDQLPILGTMTLTYTTLP